MHDFTKYCEYLYQTFYIPVYLYEHDDLRICYPEQNKDTLPPLSYLSQMWNTPNIVSYVMTSFHAYYGCVKIEKYGYSLVIGPINDISYSEETILHIGKEFSATLSETEEFSAFFHNIPSKNLDVFLNSLIFINLTLNNLQCTIRDITACTKGKIKQSIHQQYSTDLYDYKEEEILDNNYSMETEMFHYVETGNLDGLGLLTDRVKKSGICMNESDTLRQVRNKFIAKIALISRAAIRGGLTPSISYQLYNVYLEHVERMTDSSSISYLFSQVLRDYTHRVKNAGSFAKLDNTLYEAVQFIEQNTNKKITVADVADHVGYNRSYLSRRFSKELGQNLSDFIKERKLEEGKDLLAFTDKSISEISSYLSFSSQSHFQRAFKEQFHITPHAFRRSAIV
ncbi:AraC family transcriptional regulator [Saccharibacillus sp. CPCC 101409]|uniref:helix-turn-helix transcriptional regulator n=1 Tax=Saccharibacillus sp. CPCC 101409 TaxID=3058041 RepID=UPI00267296CB|nr:AraC family transcriptional regulator [Saccharibacillus sp. CPCC 101409]MDO3408245.1 AraC family transcriptional regulator [Saccharibacillus sp. CPCC 101409]